VARIVAFMATVYLARTLGVSLYGVVSFAVALLLYLALIVDFGIDQGLGISVVARDRESARQLAPVVITARLIASSIVVGIGFLVGLTLMPQPDGAVLALYGLTLLNVGVGTRWIHLGIQQAGRVAVARTLGELVMLGTVLALVHGPGDVAVAPLAQFAGDSLAAIILLRWLRRDGFRFPLRLSREALEPLVPRATPLVVSALLGLVIYNSDLMFLRFARGTEAVGFYAAAYTLISFLINLGRTFALALLPELSQLEGEQRLGVYQTAMAQVLAVTLPIAAGGYLLAPMIIQTAFGDAYSTASVALELLIWSLPLLLVRTVPVVGLMALAREDQVLRATAWAAGINLILNVTLIPAFGIVGAAAATVATEAVRLVVAVRYGLAEGLTPAGVRRYWRPVLASAAMAGAVLWVRPLGLWAAVPVGAMVYVAALTMIGGARWRGQGGPGLTV